MIAYPSMLDPSSELYASEQWYPNTALPDLLGVPVDRVDDNRLYRALDVSFQNNLLHRSKQVTLPRPSFCAVVELRNANLTHLGNDPAHDLP